MDKTFIFEFFGYFHMEVNPEINQLVSAGRRDLGVSIDSAGRRESKNRNFQLKNIYFKKK
jgi:hypothetical protein